ncbi:MAG: imidazoleglycerol-phosphate dehydratase HisB [Verrucomicrobiota bacterium]
MGGPREARVTRHTGETQIELKLRIDGAGAAKVRTGIPFFDHMLTLLAKHALFDMDLSVKGDLEVDFHHTVEDTGIALGQALQEALGDKSGIRRYGFAYLPMDETLARAALDFSGRPLVVLRLPPDVDMFRARAGDFPAQLTEEFLRGLSTQCGLTLHVEVFYTKEVHHLIEAIFKALAKALDMAVQRDPRVKGIPSTKGTLTK